MTTRRIKMVAVAIVATAGAAIGLSACSSATEGFNDAPIDHKVDRPAIIYSMPDGFANYAEKCDEFGNLVITTRGGGKGGKAVTVIPDKEACAPWAKGADAWKRR